MADMHPKSDPGLRPRILLADDDVLSRDYCQAVLDQFGLAAECVGSGTEAVEKCKKGAYQLVFMDNQMPGMDGFVATQTIRQLETTLRRSAASYIVGLTANAAAGDRERCLASGMSDYLAKPFTVEQMHAVLIRSGWVLNPADSGPGNEAGQGNAVVLLDELQELDSQLAPGMARKLTREALDGMPAKLAELERHFAAGNCAELARVAHTIRGGVSVLRLVALAEAASQLEEYALQKDQAGADRMLEQFRHALKQTIPLVEDWLEHKSSREA